MGVLDSLFGPKYATLPDDNPAALHLVEAGEPLESFVAKSNDKTEIIVGDGPPYIFVGKPPKAFGVVWFEDGERQDVRSLVEKGILTIQSAGQLARDFGTIYAAGSADERFVYRFAERMVTVTPSAELHSELQQAVERARTA